jgi:hypothetical protein
MSKDTYIELDATQERYIQFYHEYYMLRWDWDEICKYHDCSKTTLQKGLNWVDVNKLKIPAKGLLNGAIHAIRLRLKKITELYNKELDKKKQQNAKIIIELNKEIREDEKILYNLQNILVEKFDVDMDIKSTAQILKLINDAKDEDAPVDK